MHDLNELYFFHAVVAYQGYSAAARHTGVPKSTLSKRIARLEDRLQVRLLERSTRRVRTTDVGREFFEHCEAMLAAAEAAEAAAAQAHAEPHGLVRVSCPQGLIQDLMADLLPRFLKRYPQVRVQWKVINRRADFIEDHVDIALRARIKVDADNSLIVRPLGRSRLVLAMSPDLLSRCVGPLTVGQLAELPTLSMAEDSDDDNWELDGPDETTFVLNHRPRVFCSNFDLLREAAIEGLGVALLPEHICRPCIESGKLVHVLPDWHTQYAIIHAVFTNRKGLLPAVRALIDYLAAEVPRISSPG